MTSKIAVVILSLCCCLRSNAEEIRYELLRSGKWDFAGAPFIEGGFILTNGKLGSLGVDDIIDYEVRVGHPRPNFSTEATFSPEDPRGSVLVIGDVIATASTILLPATTGGDNELRFTKHATPRPGIEQRVSYFTGPDLYYTEWVEVGPGYRGYNYYVGASTLGGRTILVATVPEPNLGLLPFLILLFLGRIQPR